MWKYICDSFSNIYKYFELSDFLSSHSHHQILVCNRVCVCVYSGIVCGGGWMVNLTVHDGFHSKWYIFVTNKSYKKIDTTKKMRNHA